MRGSNEMRIREKKGLESKMKFFLRHNINFVWKYLAGILLLTAVSIFFQKEIYQETYAPGELCDYLPAGEYMLSVEYEGAPENSDLVFRANSLVTPQNRQGMDLVAEKLPAGSGELRFMITVPSETRNVFLISEYVTAWSLQSVKLLNYDNYLLALLCFLLAAVFLVYGGRFYRKEHNVVLGLLGIGVLVSLPLFGHSLPYSEDMLFHFARVNGIYEGLRTGQFPVRINPTQLADYGYMSGTMYPQLFLYLPAILKFFHISSMLGMKLLLFSANLAVPVFSYAAVRGICGNNGTAFLAAVFYTLNPYRLINFYSRGAVGEGIAMVFLPLVVWGSYEILWNRRQKWWILTLGMSGVLSSHLLSMELYAVFIFGEMVLWVFSKGRKDTLKRVAAMGKAAVGTILLNLYFLGPFLAFSRLDPRCFSLISREDLYTLDLLRAFEPFAKWGDSYESVGKAAFMSVTLGGAMLAGICLFLILLLKGGDHRQEEAVKIGKRWLVLGSLFFILSLWTIPWQQMLQSQWVYHTLGALQFPWRTFGVSAMLFSVVCAVAVTLWEETGGQAVNRFLQFILLCVLLLECGAYFGDIAHSAKLLAKPEAEASNYTDELYLHEDSLPLYYYTTDFTHISSDIEEHFSWLNALNTGPGVVCGEPESVRWTNYRKEGLHIIADVASDYDFYAAFPLHYFPGYRVLVDGVETEAYPLYSLVTCDLKKGTHHIEVSWETPAFFRVCDAVTLCVLAGWFLILLFKRRNIVRIGAESAETPRES